MPSKLCGLVAGVLALIFLDRVERMNGLRPCRYPFAARREMMILAASEVFVP